MIALGATLGAGITAPIAYNSGNSEGVKQGIQSGREQGRKATISFIEQSIDQSIKAHNNDRNDRYVREMEFARIYFVRKPSYFFGEHCNWEVPSQKVKDDWYVENAKRYPHIDWEK